MSAIVYRLRIRNAADSADALVVTSVLSGTNPYISQPPSGDGQGFDPRTGATEVGAYTVGVADNGSTANVITGFLSDGNGRYDKIGRRAYLEYSTDNGSTWPNLLVAGYVTGISYPSAAEAQVTVGEAQRAERLRQAFVVASPTTPPRSFPSVAFPATTMLAGGPIRWPADVVTPINQPDKGPWVVARIDAPSSQTTILRFVSGYALGSDQDRDYRYYTDGALPVYMRQRIDTLASAEVPSLNIAGGGYQHGNVYGDVYTMAGAFVGSFHAVTFAVPGAIGFDWSGSLGPNPFMLEGGLFVLQWTNPDPAGTQYQVYLYTRTVSENAPLHVLAHPVSIVLGLIDDAGEQWDSPSALAVLNAIGADVRVFLRITSSEATESFIARLMGLFGFGRRMNAANAWEFFEARSKPTTAPATIITAADLREIPSEIWTLDESTILNNVTVTTQRFAVWAPGQSSNRPADSLVPVESKRTARFQLADGSYPDTTQGIKELSYDLPGTILNALTSEANLTDFTSAVGAAAFDRWGYGAPGTTLVCRPTVTAAIGDEVTLDVSFLPNASVRGGQRIVQVRQRTNEAGGPVLRVEDAGTSAQPALAPTFSLTAAARSPLTAVDIALTNAVALASAGVVNVLVEYAVGASSPSASGQDIGGITPSNPVTVTTPASAAGSKVWVRMKSVQSGKRSGSFTAWSSITLSAIGAPSGLTFTADPSDGSTGALTWTAGANGANATVRVLVRPSALTSASDRTVAELRAGSTAAPLTALTPGASYTATVQYLDAATGIVATSSTLTFTAGVTTITLSAPSNAYGVVGRTDENGVARTDGTYGLDVTATEIPGVVEFWQAIETAVGSGLYGTAALLAAVPSVNSTVTSWRGVAPNDRLHRRLTARHVRTGAASSDFTYPVTLDAWGPVLGVPVAVALTNVTWTESDTTETVSFGVTDSVAEVWAGYAVVAAPVTATDFDTLVAPVVTPLPSGATTFVVPRPADGYVTLVQLEPRAADLSAGTVRRLTITAAPQPPLEVEDDDTTPTTAIQWFKLVERGIAVTAVRFATQIGANPMSAFGPPTRSEGDPSTVKGGTLGYLEFENEDLLDATRQMWHIAEYDLANGQTIRKTFPGFDRDERPNLNRVTVTGTTVVAIDADNDTKSVRLRSSSRPWSRIADGTFATFDVSVADASGNTGLPSTASDTFYAEALSDPIAGITGGTLIDSRALVITGTSAPPAAAAWDTVSVAAPPTNGDDQITITLKATAAPVGWTVKLYIAELNGVPTVDETANVSPSLSSPPTATSFYSWMSAYPRSGSGTHSRLNTLRLRADLLDNLGVVQDTRSVSASWYTGGAP